MCAKALLHQSILTRPGPFLSGCYGPIPTYFYNVLIPPAINATLLMGLTAYKTIASMKLSLGVQRPTMVILLLRDGIFYFVAVFSVLVVNILAFHLADGALTQSAAGFFVVVPCMVGSRIFLNVREQLLHPHSRRNVSSLELETYSREKYEDSGLHFADGPIRTSCHMSQVEPNSVTELVPKNQDVVDPGRQHIPSITMGQAI